MPRPSEEGFQSLECSQFINWHKYTTAVWYAVRVSSAHCEFPLSLIDVRTICTTAATQKVQKLLGISCRWRRLCTRCPHTLQGPDTFVAAAPSFLSRAGIFLWCMQNTASEAHNGITVSAAAILLSTPGWKSQPIHTRANKHAHTHTNWYLSAVVWTCNDFCFLFFCQTFTLT